jgi:hypothetical protein
MTVSSTSSVASTTPAQRVPVRRERLIGAGVTLAGVAVVTLASQVHHHVAPSEAGGWRELPYYAIAGAIGWLVAFGIAYVAPHRAADPVTAARRVGVGLAVVGVAAAALLWFTAIPICLGAAAALLVGRARRLGAPSAWDVPVRVLAAVAVLAPVVVLVVRIVQAAR